MNDNVLGVRRREPSIDTNDGRKIMKRTIFFGVTTALILSTTFAVCAAGDPLSPAEKISSVSELQEMASEANLAVIAFVQQKTSERNPSERTRVESRERRGPADRSSQPGARRGPRVSQEHAPVNRDVARRIERSPERRGENHEMLHDVLRNVPPPHVRPFNDERLQNVRQQFQN